uniref:Uncharacterized protein n=1 Tax=Oryza barthii TaxID=65489 RepID=A0A0D3EPY1_9ORYZ
MHHPPHPAAGGGGPVMPYADADRTLRALAGAAEGFGRRAIGGLHGPLYRVTSLDDDGHGTLRQACRAHGPLWIVFDAQVASQCNVYEAGAERKAVFRYVPERAADREEAEAGWVRSEGDAFLNGARPCLVDGGDAAVFRPEEYYERWTMEAASPALKEVVQLCAGWQPVPRPPGE